MHNDFWNYLFETTELIEDMANEKQDILAQVSARLATIELLYQRQFDPADSYQEFVAVKLIQSISQAINR